MALYDRLAGRDDSGQQVPNRIPYEEFMAVLAEVARGSLTRAQAQAAVLTLSGAPLQGQEVTDASAMLDSVLAPPSAAGKLARVAEILDVFRLSARQVPNYETPSQVRSRLGLTIK